MQSSGAWRFDLGVVMDAIWDSAKGALSDAFNASFLAQLAVLSAVLVVLTVFKTIKDARMDDADF